MKRFVFLTFISLSAQAACDYEIRDRMYRTPEQMRELKCDLNFKCVEATIRNPKSTLDEIDTLVDYSRDNRCKDELKLTELFERLMAESEPEDDEEIKQNNSDRGNNKFDLPIIPDAPAESKPTRVDRQ